MKKKLFSLASCLTLMLLLSACGGTGEVTYGDYSAADMEYMTQHTAESIMALTPEEVAEYVDYYGQYADEDEDAALNYSLISDWSEVMQEVGVFQGYSDFSVDKSGKTITATLTMDFDKRDARLIYVFNAFNMDITAINVEPVYSLGEIMQTAALNTVMGILTVFVILVLISLVIFAFNIIPYLEKKFTKQDKQEAESALAVREDVAAAAATEDTELVAVIAAAIASATGTSTDSFVVRSIKRRF